MTDRTFFDGIFLNSKFSGGIYTSGVLKVASTSKIKGIVAPGKKRRLNVSAKLDILKIVDGRPNATKKDLAAEIGIPV